MAVAVEIVSCTEARIVGQDPDDDLCIPQMVSFFRDGTLPVPQPRGVTALLTFVDKCKLMYPQPIWQKEK